MQLSPVQERFVLHWGEMGTRWGVNRTVAQIHALLYLAPRPLHAEEIADTLSVARSNVSGSLRELQGWGIARVVHVLGDRRDHFESPKDVWEMFRVILEERKRRECDPTLAVLSECIASAGEADPYTQERIEEMHGFFTTLVGLYDEVHALPPGALRRVARLRGKVRALLGPPKTKGKGA